MNFDSPFFLFFFLPVILLLHSFIKNTGVRNVLLLVSGLLFYSFGRISWLLLLLCSAAVNYFISLLMLRSRSVKPLTVIAVILNLAFLGVFKYLDFFLGALSPLFGSELSVGIAAPIGISFFTFRCISYIIDLSRSETAGTKSFFRLLLYISFFPQLMAGPISRFSDFDPQLDSRSCTSAELALGLRRFIIGLCKKLLIASVLGSIADSAFAFVPQSADFRLAWLGAIAYTLQIYFDFSGYSDMAIGLSRCFGFVTSENFDYPYISSSITEFWRRWHISLSSWFKDYLYIPLGGNRKGRLRTALNKLIVFTLCGLWHGSALTFILWGAWHGILSALESLKVINISRLGRNAAGRLLCRIYTLLAVCLGFVVFRAADIKEGLAFLSAMFSASSAEIQGTVLVSQLLSPKAVFILIAAVICSLPFGKRLYCRLCEHRLAEPASFILCAVLFVFCLMQLASGGFSPFIYFQF